MEILVPVNFKIYRLQLILVVSLSLLVVGCGLFPVVSVAAQFGRYDLYINGELMAESVPVKNPVNFVPRGIDFALSSKRWQGTLKLVPREIVPSEHGVASGVSEVVYSSLANPYYGKVTWEKPVEWQSFTYDSLPIRVEARGVARERFRWIDVSVAGEDVVFREKFDKKYEERLNLFSELDSPREVLGDTQTESVAAEVGVTLFDDFGNSLRIKPRKVHLAPPENNSGG